MFITSAAVIWYRVLFRQNRTDRPNSHRGDGGQYDVRWSRRPSIVTRLVIDGSEYYLDEMMVRAGGYLVSCQS